jgi:hypothetical protein
VQTSSDISFSLKYLTGFLIHFIKKISFEFDWHSISHTCAILSNWMLVEAGRWMSIEIVLCI